MIPRLGNVRSGEEARRREDMRFGHQTHCGGLDCVADL